MDQREPIELPVEHIPNSPSRETSGPFIFQAQFGGSQPPPFGMPYRLQPRRPRRLLPFLLFIATCFSTLYAGGVMFGDRTLRAVQELQDGQIVIVQRLMTDWTSPNTWTRGAQYSLALMAILVAHEMGHFLQAVRYRVPASWPWFIPMPFTPLGTMGAVIVQRSGWADRKQMFDIGISGPLAGLVVAIPVTILGLQTSRIENIEAFDGGVTFGNPLLLQWLAEWHFGRPLLDHQDITLTPLLHAGWVGILITALNLVPIGQLDGGHILYGLIRKRAHSVAYVLLWAAVIWMMTTSNWSYAVMIFLLLTLGTRHPPTRDDSVPLGGFRIVLGWLTLAFILIGFTPNPISFESRPPREERRKEEEKEEEPPQSWFVKDRKGEQPIASPLQRSASVSTMFVKLKNA